MPPWQLVRQCKTLPGCTKQLSWQLLCLSRQLPPPLRLAWRETSGGQMWQTCLPPRLLCLPPTGQVNTHNHRQPGILLPLLFLLLCEQSISSLMSVVVPNHVWKSRQICTIMTCLKSCRSRAPCLDYSIWYASSVGLMHSVHRPAPPPFPSPPPTSRRLNPSSVPANWLANKSCHRQN